MKKSVLLCSLYLICFLVLPVSVRAYGVVGEGFCEVYVQQDGLYMAALEQTVGTERDGLSAYFYQDGDVRQVSQFSRGVRHGLKRRFWKNGELRQAVSYQDGLLHGAMIAFSRSGDILSFIPYRQGRPHGVARFFSEDLLRSYQTRFENGVPSASDIHQK
ncbi:MAG: toxin-antitoxin system YwqK family antitoxin [Candidatus Omnitrophota bacterium]